MFSIILIGKILKKIIVLRIVSKVFMFFVKEVNIIFPILVWGIKGYDIFGGLIMIVYIKLASMLEIIRSIAVFVLKIIFRKLKVKIKEVYLVTASNFVFSIS